MKHAVFFQTTLLGIFHEIPKKSLQKILLKMEFQYMMKPFHEMILQDFFTSLD